MAGAGRGVERAAAGLATWLAPVDRMLLAFVAFLAVVAALAYPRPLPVLVTLGALAATTAVAGAWGARSGVGRVVHAFVPLPIVVTIFNVAGPLIGAANPARWDATFASLDTRIFGAALLAWRGLLGRPAWLSDLASIAYVSYYFIPVAMSIALWVKGRRREFDDLAFVLIATLLVSYVGYFLFPTTGPRVPEALEVEVLGGGAISARVRDFLRVAEINVLDAFPSGHTALSLVFLAQGWRLFPRASVRAPLLLAVVGIVFATVYLSLHYVVDLCAGAAQAALMPAVVAGLRRVFGTGGVAESRSPGAPG
jgi:membrane-associated phospholipid phosphatase